VQPVESIQEYLLCKNKFKIKTMKTEKLTLRDCFKYPNARIKDGSIVWDNITNFIMEESELHHNLDWKLILRPLSSLTDEEKSKIKKIYFTPNIKSDDVGYLAFKVDGCSEEQIWYDDIKIADYLRSISIDIDSLQERGLCIYE
jgi:hypothetical protein